MPVPILENNGGGAAIDTIQAVNATGLIAAWNSTIVYGAVAPTANGILTVPPCSAADIGKKITIRRVDTSGFALATVPTGADSAKVDTPASLNGTGAITLVCTSATSYQQISNISQTSQSEVTQYYLDPRTQANPPTISTAVNSFAIERILWNLPSIVDANIVYNPATGIFRVLNAGRYRISYRINSRFAGATNYLNGVYSFTTGTFLYQDFTGGNGTQSGDQVVAGHRRTTADVILDLTAGTEFAVAYTGGYGVWASYFDTAAFLGALTNAQMSTWNYVNISKESGFISGNLVGAVPGDIKLSPLLSDHGNWILLDQRAKNTLTLEQQAVATALGYGANLPDYRGRMAIGAGGTFGAVVGAIGGSLTIGQNNLPNVGLSFSGSTGNAGAHSHTINGNANGNTGGSQGTFSTVSASSWNVISSAPDHAHSFSGTTGSLSGGAAQQNFISPYFAQNWFVWLGPIATTVTLAQPLALTTNGAGNATFNPITGALNIPNLIELLMA
jgi:microcystin-dependent protein